MAGHYFGASRGSAHRDAFQVLAQYAAEHGAPRARPYLVHPKFWPSSGDHLRATYDHLRAEYDHLRAEYDHLRAEYEASRPAFDCPLGVGNVWTHSTVHGSERLRAEDGSTLHPCQKPVMFAERMIRASSRPGDTVWAPFGGTIREAVAAEQIARSNPEEAPRDYGRLEPGRPGLLGPSIRRATGAGYAAGGPPGPAFDDSTRPPRSGTVAGHPCPVLSRVFGPAPPLIPGGVRTGLGV